MKKVTYTSLMSKELMYWLSDYSILEKRSKSDIIEESLKLYRKKKEQELFAESFQRAQKDRDMHDLAELNFEDLLI